MQCLLSAGVVTALRVAHVAATCPLEDRTAERRVFPRFSADGAEKAMRMACKTAENPALLAARPPPSAGARWHHDGVPTKALAERVGHADAALTLNVYSSHVLDPGELPQESLEALLVWSPCGLGEPEPA